MTIVVQLHSDDNRGTATLWWQSWYSYTLMTIVVQLHSDDNRGTATLWWQSWYSYTL